MNNSQYTFRSNKFHEHRKYQREKRFGNPDETMDSDDPDYPPDIPGDPKPHPDEVAPDPDNHPDPGHHRGK